MSAKVPGTVPRQGLRFIDFSSSADLLALAPELRDGDPWPARRQMRYIADHVLALGCRAMLIEEHYIDRHYMEEYAEFYSRSLTPYPNHCQRVHFFRGSKAMVRGAFQRLVRNLEPGTGNNPPDLGTRRKRYLEACRTFCLKSYLGFSVIKPLPGCPVGRTVLEPLPRKGLGFSRDFTCSTRYIAHVQGVRLTVKGLAFQQQDLGVSACATTALWTSLQKLQRIDETPSVSPVQVTLTATKYALPFGRAFPSEGLSLDQICQAVRAIGASPYVVRLDSTNVRWLLHSIGVSGFPAVLVLDDLGLSRHAVALSGLRLQEDRPEARIGTDAEEEAADLAGPYIHDDRIGPYVPTELTRASRRAWLSWSAQGQAAEKWCLTHLIVPLNPKIRLSFGELRALSVHAAKNILRLLSLDDAAPRLKLSSLISLSHPYLEYLASQAQGSSKLSRGLSSKVALSRYLGVLRFRGEGVGQVDLLVDTTSTRRNPNYLAVVASRQDTYTDHLLAAASNLYGCPCFGPP